MTVVLIGTAPSREPYEQIAAAAHVSTDPPPGIIVHTATEMPDGTVKIVDVWESRQAVEAFERDRLIPAFEAGGGQGPPPDRDLLEPFDVVRAPAAG
jgi:heme-degrading monooxygenase HmoA